MHKFRKRPIVIEAFQMTKERRLSNADWPNWLNLAWNKDSSEEGAVYPEDFPNSNGNDQLLIRNSYGVISVNWDDFIIRGVLGELYICEPDSFAATYDKE